MINSHNLKLIIKSPQLLQSIRSTNDVVFAVWMFELLIVVDEPVIYLGDIIKVDESHLFEEFAEFKTAEQLERLETLTGRLVSSFFPPNCDDYFKYRRIFKVHEGKGQVPENLSENTHFIFYRFSIKIKLIIIKTTG